MLPLLWLAFSVPPSVIELAPVPVMDALVVQRLADPPQCLIARCVSGEWKQALGERTNLSQVTRIETGQRGTYLRNSLLLKFQLQPTLTLDTGVELRRDSEVTGRNQTDAKLNLRYVF